jgi:hypothetical protein
MIGEKSETLDVVTVMINSGVTQNTVLDLGTEYQVEMNKLSNAFRATPIPKT